MKKLIPTMTTVEQKSVKNFKKKAPLVDIRVGKFFRQLEQHQQRRFNRIVSSIARKYGLNMNTSPMEMVLIRQIALNTIRIEEAECELIDNPSEKWLSDVEKWLLLMQKERREAISLLSTLFRVGSKQEEVNDFGNLRDILRKKEGLEKSENKDKAKNGHDRRYYDKVTRTKKPKSV